MMSGMLFLDDQNDPDHPISLMEAHSDKTSEIDFILPNLEQSFNLLQEYLPELSSASNSWDSEGDNEEETTIVTSPPTRATANVKNWDNSTSTLPPWMKDYFQWHKEQRLLLTNATNFDNDTKKRYLVMTCFHGAKCGGVTDRLRPIPAMIRAAYQSQRILLIYWERPFALEEFLEPPQGGLDWRVPAYMVDAVRVVSPSTRWGQYHDLSNDNPIVTTLYQSWNYGWLWYDEQKEQEEPPALEVFKDTWNTVFQMTPPVQALFDTTFDKLQLTSGEFATAHIRALYDLESRPHSQTIGLVQNAMNCASMLRPGGPFLVASDLLDALHVAQDYGREKNVTVVTPSWNREPLHIGLHNESDPNVTPQDFYTVFVDIYLLSQSRCVAVGPGGFGYWAQIMGHNHSCWIRHSGERSRKCTWHDKNEEVEKEEPAQAINRNSTASFIVQMQELAKEKLKVKEAAELSFTAEGKTETNIHRVHVNFTYSTHYALWENATLVPEWIKEYFEWHKQQRALLTRESFREQRYIIMTCWRGDRCGGMTDRLRPILTHLQVAHNTSRLFFIHWERPFPLEEFLLPPDGGLDWRMPPFLLDELRKTQPTGALDLNRFKRQKPMIVSTRYQSWHYGELQYNQNKGASEPDATTTFREVWNAVFTPSPPVAQMIADSFRILGIVPGHYATAHVRALYGIEKRGTREIRAMVNNALNCLSRLRPGGPYLVAADSAEAVRLAKEYGAYRNVTVVSPPHGKHPLHLGLHNESDSSIVPSDFYDVFNDMYLIAETRCMVVGKGGFGRWGILLGHEPGCSIFHNGFKAETCEWSDPEPGKEDVVASHPYQARMTIFRKPAPATVEVP